MGSHWYKEYSCNAEAFDNYFGHAVAFANRISGSEHICEFRINEVLTVFEGSKAILIFSFVLILLLFTLLLSWI